MRRRGGDHQADRPTQRQSWESLGGEQKQKSNWRGGDRQTERQREKAQRQPLESKEGEQQWRQSDRKETATGVCVCEDNLH